MDWIQMRLDAGIIERREVPGAAPMFIQLMKDGRIRILVDLRKRNDNTIKDNSPILNQQQMLDAAARARFRTLLDLGDAYSQTRVHPDDVKYNSFKTAF